MFSRTSSVALSTSVSVPRTLRVPSRTPLAVAVMLEADFFTRAAPMERSPNVSWSDRARRATAAPRGSPARAESSLTSKRPLPSSSMIATR